MLNFNSLNKTEKDIILSHNIDFKMLCSSVRDDDSEKFLRHCDNIDLAIDNSFLAKYAASQGNAKILKLILDKSYSVDRPQVLISCIAGNNDECLELLGELSDLELSAAAFAAAVFYNNHNFLIKYAKSLTTNKDYQEYNLISIAARQGHASLLDYLLTLDMEFDSYDALVTAGANEDEAIISSITWSPNFDNSEVGDGIIDSAIVAATYGNSKTLSEIFNNYGDFFIHDKQHAIGKAAIYSEDIDTVNVYIDNNGKFDFDNVMAIVAGLSGEAVVIDGNKHYHGNLDMFKLIESNCSYTEEQLKGTVLNTAKAYNRKKIVQYIESK